MKLLLSIFLILPSCCYLNQTNPLKVGSTGASSKNELHASLSVSCDPDAIVVTVPKVAVQPTTSSSYIMFKQSSTTSCQAFEVDADKFELRLNRKQSDACGSIVKRSSGNRASYRNEVVYLDVENAKIISLFNFTCLYVGDDNVPILPSTYKKKLVAGKEVEIRLFRDDSFERTSLFFGDFPTVSVEEFLFVEILSKSLTYESPNTNLFFVEWCSASVNTEVENAIHYFIYKGCAGFHDSTTEILNASRNSVLRFKFQMFKWVNVTVQSIYIFCNVSVCKISDLAQSGACSLKECGKNSYNASGQHGARNKEFAVDESFVVAAGPIFPSSSIFLKDRPFKNKNDDLNKNNKNWNFLQEGSEDGPNVVHIVVGIMSTICSVIIAVVIYVFWRRGVFKKIFRKRTAAPAQEERIQPGFAFILQSSDDKPIFKQAGEETSRRNRAGRTNKRNSLTGATTKNLKCESTSNRPNRSHSFQESLKTHVGTITSGT